MTYQAAVTQYVEDIKTGKIIAGTYAKKAINRYCEDLKRSQDEDFLYFMDWNAVNTVCSFAEALKPGDLNGKPLKLLPWQIFCFANLEGWRHKAEPDRKRFRTAYISVNRKNGKTTGILQPLILFNFLKYKASESYIVSSRDDLSEKTFKEIKDIINADSELAEILDCKSLAVTFKDTAETSRLSFFCDGGKDADGFRPRFYCLDEYHAFQSDKMYTSMTYGARSKKDAQGVIITTADVEISGPCYQVNLKAKKILNGILDQPDFFTIIYEIDENDDFHDSKCWQKANPSLYDIIDPSVIQSDIEDAELTPHKLPELKAKTFGIWGGGGEKSWLSVETWQKNKNITVNWSDFDGVTAYGGLDLSQVDDLTAFTLKFIKDGKHFYKHRFYIPEDTAQERYKKEHINFLSWIDSGIITAIPGKTIDYDFIVRDILEAADIYKIRAIGYDRWQARDVINGIEDARPDIILVEIEQSLRKLSPLTQSYEKTIKDGLLVDNNPAMAWMISNVEVRPDVNGNYKPMKKSKASTQRIDGVISSIMAHGVSINPDITAEIPQISFDRLKALL